MRYYPIVFTGKEKDEETGYSYFGARYMDHELMTMWLSVDPMADKYPSISPYAYCAWNPVKLVDPNGSEIGDIYNKRGQHIGNDGQEDNNVYLCNTTGNVQLTEKQSQYLIKNRMVKNITKESGLGNKELLDRATWVCGESGGSDELISTRIQNKGNASRTLDATVADYYAAAINNMSIATEGGFYYAIKDRMSREDGNGNIIHTNVGYFEGTGKGGNSHSKAFAEARKMGYKALNTENRFTNSIAAVINSVTKPDPTGGCRAWLGGFRYAKPYVNIKNKSKPGATVQFSFQSRGGYHSFYRN